MDIISLAFIGIIIFCVGMALMWKSKKRMTPDEKAIYDAAFMKARKGVLKEKGITDAKNSVLQGGGLGASLQKFAEGFGNFQEEGRKMGLPSLLDYDKEEKNENRNKD